MKKAVLGPGFLEYLKVEALAWVARDKLNQVTLASTQSSMLRNLLKAVLFNYSFEKCTFCFLHYSFP